MNPTDSGPRSPTGRPAPMQPPSSFLVPPGFQPPGALRHPYLAPPPVDQTPGPIASIPPFWSAAPPAPADRPTDHLLISGLLAFGLGLCLYLLRAPVGRAVAVGLTAGLLIFLLLWLLNARARSWAPPPEVPTSARARAPRWEVPRYDRMFARPPDFGEPTRARLRSIVEGRLNRHGVDFDSDQARLMLGAGPHQLLTAIPDRPPSVARLRELADAVQRILPADQFRHPADLPARSSKGLPTA